MNKYILFELDHGGPTNIILAFKFLVYIAYITNRVLIIPPSKSIYHYDWGPNGLNESVNNFKNITKTNLIDIINLKEFRKLVKIITFDDFYNLEKDNLKLPNNFNNFHQIQTDYETMNIQGNRLKNREKTNRGLYWVNMANYLSNIKIKYNEKHEWIIFSKKNFITIKLKRKYIHDSLYFITKIKKINKNIIFLPMDTKFLTREYTYPRIFMYSANFETNNNIWKKINSLKYLNKKFYKIAKIIIKKYLCDGNYDALHWRYNGFNERKEYNGIEIMDMIKKWIKSDNLYISTDSYEKIFKNIDKSKYKFNIFSVKILMKEFENNITKKDISFIEQIICAKSNIFIGTNISSFSSEILNIRTKKLNCFRILKDLQDSKNYFI